MTLASYRIKSVFNVGQPLRNPWRGWPMGLSAIVSDTELPVKFNRCISRCANQSICAQKVLDKFTVIYQTYYELKAQGPVSTSMVEVNGKLRKLTYIDDGDSHLTGLRLVGNVLPLTSGVYLATDWFKGTVTTFIAPHFESDKDEMTESRRGRTVSLSKGARIGGITRDNEHLIARVGKGPKIHFYRLDHILVSGEVVAKKPIEVKRMVRPQCLNESGIYQNIKLNEIEYEPKSKKLWGVQRESARIIEFDLESGKCVGELNLVEALKNYALEMNDSALARNHCEFKAVVNKLDEVPFTVVNGITFIAKNWLIVSVENITTRFIVQIDRN